MIPTILNCTIENSHNMLSSSEKTSKSCLAVSYVSWNPVCKSIPSHTVCFCNVDGSWPDTLVLTGNKSCHYATHFYNMMREIVWQQALWKVYRLQSTTLIPVSLVDSSLLGLSEICRQTGWSKHAGRVWVYRQQDQGELLQLLSLALSQQVTSQALPRSQQCRKANRGCSSTRY